MFPIKRRTTHDDDDVLHSFSLSPSYPGSYYDDDLTTGHSGGAIQLCRPNSEKFYLPLFSSIDFLPLWDRSLKGSTAIGAQTTWTTLIPLYRKSLFHWRLSKFSPVTILAACFFFEGLLRWCARTHTHSVSFDARW